MTTHISSVMGFLTTSLHKNCQNDVKLLETWWFWPILGKVERAELTCDVIKKSCSTFLIKFWLYNIHKITRTCILHHIIHPSSVEKFSENFDKKTVTYIILLHFVAFFHVASLFSTGVENKKVGVDNKKALELTNSTVFHRGRQWKSSRAGQQNNFFIFQPDFNVEISPKNATKHPVA